MKVRIAAFCILAGLLGAQLALAQDPAASTDKSAPTAAATTAAQQGNPGDNVPAPPCPTDIVSTSQPDSSNSADTPATKNARSAKMQTCAEDPRKNPWNVPRDWTFIANASGG